MQEDMRSVLASYGLAPVAQVRISNRQFIIETTNHEITALEKCIYAFVVGEKIVRIGSSKSRLKMRLRSWERHVTRALNGEKSSTPRWEAEGWNKELSEHGSGTIFARQGALVSTPVGSFPAYLDEESLLIGRFRPWLNRCKHR